MELVNRLWLMGFPSGSASTFATTTVHLGKPPRSMISVVFKCAIVAARKAFGAPETGSLALSLREDGSARIRGTSGLIWHLLKARDRWRCSPQGASARCPGRAGCDGSLSAPPDQGNGWLCGRPRDGVNRGRPVSRLAQWEKAYYERIEDPDVLVVLRVDPDVAVARRPDEDADFVRTRCAEVWSANWEGTPAVVVDAGRSRDEVLSEVKTYVWSLL